MSKYLICSLNSHNFLRLVERNGFFAHQYLFQLLKVEVDGFL